MERSARVAALRTTRRRGRTSPTKEATLDSLLPHWTTPWPPATEGFALDLGVGDGAATVAWAHARPDLSVIAIDVYRPGLAKLLQALEADGPPNVRVLEADATEIIATAPTGAIQAIRLLFPDPWPKRRHVERRIVDRGFVVAAADALGPGGELHLATDWDDYAEHARTMIATEARFEPLDASARIERPITVYEARGLAAGRTITELVYRRRRAPG